MSRLLDRILTSCQRFRPSMLDDETKREATVAAVLNQLRQRLGPNLPKETVARVRAQEGQPVSLEEAPLAELANIPVIVANDVALYVSALGMGTDMSDIVASMAPPFDQFFIEFQRVPNDQYNLHAWGARITAVSDPAEMAKIRPPPFPRWVLVMETYLEKHKGELSDQWLGITAGLPKTAHGSGRVMASCIGQESRFGFCQMIRPRMCVRAGAMKLLNCSFQP